MNKEDIINFIGERAKPYKPTKVTENHTLEELGFDSLDKIELLYDLSDKTGIEVDTYKKYDTVNDVIEFFKSDTND